MKQFQSIKKERKRFKAQRRRRIKRLELLGFNVKDLLDELPFFGENSGPADKGQATGEAAVTPDPATICQDIFNIQAVMNQSNRKDKKRFRAQRRRKIQKLEQLGFDVKDLFDELQVPRGYPQPPVPDPSQNVPENLIKVGRIDFKKKLIGSSEANETWPPVDGTTQPTNNFINAEANAVKREHDSSDDLNDNETIVAPRRMTARSCRGFKYESKCLQRS
jgi:hypothetical protein